MHVLVGLRKRGWGWRQDRREGDVCGTFRGREKEEVVHVLLSVTSSAIVVLSLS